VRKLVSLLVFAMTVGGAWAQYAQAGAIRISQIYVGGGSSAGLQSPLNADFIELFNAGGTPTDVSGWLLAYGGSNPTSSFGCAGCTNAIPAGTTIQPCAYLLIQVSPVRLGFGLPLPSPDATLPFGNGLVAVGTMGLLSSGTPSGSCLTGQPGLEDLVGWAEACGSGSGSGVPAIDQAHALLRKDGGMALTGDNFVDFVLGTPTPRNSASPENALCVQTPARNESWGSFKALYR
jgi:hypothetical protein